MSRARGKIDRQVGGILLGGGQSAREDRKAGEEDYAKGWPGEGDVQGGCSPKCADYPASQISGVIPTNKVGCKQA